MLQDGYDNTQLRSQEFLSGITKSFTGLTAQYIPKDQALEDLVKVRNPWLAVLVEQNDENPLPNSIRISNIDINSYRDVNIYISNFKDILQYDEEDLNKKLTSYKAQYERISQVVDMLKILKFAVFILLALFVFTVSIVVYMVIHNFIFFLRDEIRIIELVWGNPSFIYGPFVLQGFIYATIASLLAVGSALWILSILKPHPAFVDFRGFLSGFTQIFAEYSWVIIGVFACIGAISAFLASWRYIHSTIAE